ncbi:Pvc16 family protein [Pontixanthobacter aestiaquae]|uniref:DUF4255 domain-containing protein n=1 Tax=Pontixanthobacter aestiaquae TaxID=1509367 RepID=A0A844Z5P5_9SPHN|nr:Pvc16 family protein [Pontixanthobacter aestiaquae]MDN3646359.1 Pvc16 family protein [Pontixanthobacter aestiaquae]MXO82652.1 DUF4255 domain-containing protein [Pontixanthobacter aestiaquae]
MDSNWTIALATAALHSRLRAIADTVQPGVLVTGEPAGQDTQPAVEVRLYQIDRKPAVRNRSMSRRGGAGQHGRIRQPIILDLHYALAVSARAGFIGEALCGSIISSLEQHPLIDSDELSRAASSGPELLREAYEAAVAQGTAFEPLRIEWSQPGAVSTPPPLADRWSIPLYCKASAVMQADG